MNASNALSRSRKPPTPRMEAMGRSLARNWWALALRGALAILFGIAAFALPFVTVQVLVLLFAAYLFADGLLAILSAIRAAQRHERWGALIFEGLVNIAAGLVAVAIPGVTVLVLVSLLGAWGVVSGALAIYAALRLHHTHGRGWMGFAGVVSVVWGAAMFWAPGLGAVVLTWWLGGYAIIFGAAMLLLAFRLRSRRHA